MTIFRRDPLDGGVESGGYEKNHNFRSISRFVSETIKGRAIVTMESQSELVCDLSNGAVSSDLGDL